MNENLNERELWQMALRSAGVRIGVIGGIVASTLFGAAPAAFATEMGVSNWTGSMSGVLTGFQSRDWDDESYSEVRFKDCVSSNSGSKSVHVDLRWRRDFQPDVSWGTKMFTNCFNGSTAVSSGEWTGLSNGKHFFQIKYINGQSSGHNLDVRVVAQDTTQAD